MKISPIKGFHYALEGLRLIKRPELRLFVIAPIAVSLLIYTIAAYFCIANFDGITGKISGFFPDWEILKTLIDIVVFLCLIFLFIFTFTFLTNLVASPFLGLLSEKTELLLTGKPIDSGSGWGEMLKSIPASIGRELKKLGYYLPRLIAVFILAIILTPVAPLIWFLFGAWMMSVQYIDYPIDNNRQSFDELKRHLTKNRAASLGYGAVIILFMMIPVVSIVVIPAAVAGATAFWVKEKESHALNQH